jgi:hypothetical protein
MIHEFFIMFIYVNPYLYLIFMVIHLNYFFIINNIHKQVLIFYPYPKQHYDRSIIYLNFIIFFFFYKIYDLLMFKINLFIHFKLF